MKESAKQICLILEKHGGTIADKARTILLEDPALQEMREPLQFIKQNWRDLTPAFMSLSCEAVGGKPEEIHEVALAICLMNLSFTTWDDIIDNSKTKTFKPTTFGKFGQAQAIIIGGLAAAKAFTILNKSKLKNKTRKKITKSVWNLWSKMATVETTTLKMREQDTLSSNKKLNKIKSEVIDLGAILKIGAIIGNGSTTEIKHLERYGQYLGIMLALQQDFQVSVNLTLELEEKIKSKRLPYSLLWATEHSKNLKLDLETYSHKDTIDSTSIKKFINHALDTGILNHIDTKIEEYKKKANHELDGLAVTNATQSLQSLLSITDSLQVSSEE